MFQIVVDFPKAALDLSEFKKADYDVDDIAGFLDSLCDKLSDPHNLVFRISGFGDHSWPVDSRYDLPIFLEQLPTAIQALRSDSNFEIDFCGQGIERKVAFSIESDAVHARCQSFSSWQPQPTVETLEKQDLSMMFRNSMSSLLSFIEDHFPEMLNHPILTKWKNSQ